MVDTYLADTGVFNANTFINRIMDHTQRLRFLELMHMTKIELQKEPLTVSDISRAMMLNASVHWKDGIDSSLIAYVNHL